MQVISNFSKRSFHVGRSVTLSRGKAAEWVLNTHNIICLYAHIICIIIIVT